MNGSISRQGLIIKIMLLLLVIVVISVPVLFTLYKEGRFASKPSVTTVSTVTDDTAETLTFAADYDFEPYSFYDENGNPSGLSIELATEIANRMNKKVKIVLGNWPQCKSDVVNPFCNTTA